MNEIKATLGSIPSFGASLKGITVTKAPDITSHEQLSGRDLPDQHPASAISGISEALESAIGEAKASGMFDGKDGADGKDGYTPQKGIDYFDGNDGTSVTVTNVSQSTADGGNNVVTFSDGKTLTVKNGSKGSDGAPGKDGADGKDYVLTDADKAELAQMAADTVDVPTALKNPNALTINGTAYDGSSAVNMELAKPSDIPTVPSALKNPNALTINGTAYDGSKAVSVNITEGLEPLIGTTAEITPTQVAEAIAEGRAVAIEFSLVALGISVIVTCFSELDGTLFSVLDVGEGKFIFTGNLASNSWDAQIYQSPTELPNPKALTFTGGASGSYDGSEAKTVDIPTKLPNPSALTINGTSYDGSSAVTVDTKVVRAAFTYYAESVTGIGGMRATCDIAPSELVGYMSSKTVIAELTAENGVYIGSAVFGKKDLLGAVADIVTADGIYRITGISTNAGYSVEIIPLASGADGGIVIFEEAKVSGSIVNNLSFELGAEYDIYWNDKKYVCTSYESESEVYTGNGYIINTNLPDTGEPFLFTHMAGATSCLLHKATGAASSNTLMVATHGYNTGSSGTDIDVVAEVGQTIVVEEVDANGKPTKWKAADFQEKICGTEGTVLLPETSIISDGSTPFEATLDFVIGETYDFVWNGTVYPCEALNASTWDDDMDGAIGFGNVDLMMGTGDNGIPFVLVYMGGVGQFVSTDGSTSGTLSIWKGLKITPIPQKYLYDATHYVPYYGTETGIVIGSTPDEIDAAYYSNANVVLKYIVSDTAEMLLPLAAREVRSDSRRVYAFGGYFVLTNAYDKITLIETAEGSNELEVYTESSTT